MIHYKLIAATQIFKNWKIIVAAQSLRNCYLYYEHEIKILNKKSKKFCKKNYRQLYEEFSIKFPEILLCAFYKDLRLIDLPKQNASKAEYVHYKFCMKNTCNTAFDLMIDFENTFNKDIISVKILLLEHWKGFIKVND